MKMAIVHAKPTTLFGATGLLMAGYKLGSPDPFDRCNGILLFGFHNSNKVPATVTSRNIVQSTPANGTIGNASIYGFDPLVRSALPDVDVFGAPIKFNSADDDKEVAARRCAGIQEMLAVHTAGDGTVSSLRSLILDSRFVKNGHFPISRFGWLFLPLFRADLVYAAPNIAFPAQSSGVAITTSPDAISAVDDLHGFVQPGEVPFRYDNGVRPISADLLFSGNKPLCADVSDA